MSFFSQNDGGLKNLTHDFNYGYIDYDVFIAQCKKEFEEGKEKYPKASKRLLARIEAFAFKESPDWFIRRGKEKETQGCLSEMKKGRRNKTVLGSYRNRPKTQWVVAYVCM